MWGFDETLGQGVAGVIHTDGTSAAMVGVASGVSSKIDIVLKGKDSMTWHSVGGSSDGRILLSDTSFRTRARVDSRTADDVATQYVSRRVSPNADHPRC